MTYAKNITHDIVRVSGAQTPSQARLPGRRIKLRYRTCDVCGSTITSKADVALNQRRAENALRGLMPLAITTRLGDNE